MPGTSCGAALRLGELLFHLQCPPRGTLGFLVGQTGDWDYHRQHTYLGKSWIHRAVTIQYMLKAA